MRIALPRSQCIIIAHSRAGRMILTIARTDAVSLSAFDNDLSLTGSIDEFRANDNPLRDCEVAAAFDTGPRNLPTIHPAAAK
jgi:hypothetical protein